MAFAFKSISINPLLNQIIFVGSNVFFYLILINLNENIFDPLTQMISDGASGQQLWSFCKRSSFMNFSVLFCRWWQISIMLSCSFPFIPEMRMERTAEIKTALFYLQTCGDKPPFFIVEYIFEYIYIFWWWLTCKPEKRNWGQGEELWDRGKDSGEPFWADSIKETFLHKNISHFLFQTTPV